MKLNKKSFFKGCLYLFMLFISFFIVYLTLILVLKQNFSIHKGILIMVKLLSFILGSACGLVGFKMTKVFNRVYPYYLPDNHLPK